MADELELHDNPEEELDEQHDEADPSDEGATEDGDPLKDKPELQKALYKLYLKCCDEDRYGRIQEIRKVQQACMYWRGLQYCWWSQVDESWNMPNQQHGLQLIPTDTEDMPRFEFVTNIYQAFGLSLIAAIAQAPPRTRWFPEDADNPKDVETAEGKTKLSKIIERWNPITVQMQDEVYHLFTGGVVGGWTRYIADGEKYGFESVEDMEQQEQESPDEVRCAKCGFVAPLSDVDMPGPCPNCGETLTEDNISSGESTSVPSSAGESQVPKGREVIEIIGALNLKRPQYAQSQSEYHYLSFEKEIHYAKLRAAHPDVADKIKPGLTMGEDNGFERNARMSVMQGTDLQSQTGAIQSCLVTYARIWFRPTAFFSTAIDKAEREELLDIFPRGCRVNFAGPVFCESEEQSMDDAWAVAHAFPGDGENRPGLGTSLISVQDRYNTWTNIEAETYEYQIPINYRAADMFDSEADSEQNAEPGQNVDVQLQPGVDIRTRLMQTQGGEPAAGMLAGMQQLMGPVGQFLTGAFPALQGAGGAEAAAGSTAAGYKMQMEQALGRCGVSYVRLKQFHADLQTLSCADYCEHASGKTKMSVLGDTGDFETESVDVDALEGDAKAYPEGDENFPVLWTEQRNIFMQIMQSAQGQALMQDPQNAELGVRLIGIPGLVLPGALAKKKALRIIGFLTEIPEPGEGDIADPMQPVMSQPANIAEYVDQDVDPPIAGAIVQSCMDWLLDDDGFKCQKENSQGFINVRNYMKAVKGLIAPPPPPEKPLSPSMTMAVDKMPPAAQAQILKQWGVNLTEEDFVDQTLQKLAEKSKVGEPPKPPTGAPPPGQAAKAANPGKAG